MKSLTIYLGSKCNLNCAYCHREPDIDEPKISQKLINYIKDNKIENINFIGGEPTLYIDDIKKIVELFPNSKFRVTTNGVGIKKYLPYFYEHKFLVCISYDGSNKNLRGYDPFTSVIDYPWLAISCTLYRGNTDFKKIIKNFKKKEKLIGRRLSFYPHIMHYTTYSNLKLKLLKKDFDFLVSQYKEYVTKYVLDYVNYGIENITYKGLFTQLRDRYYANYEFGETYCVNKKINKCNSNGDLYSCLYIRDESPEQIKDRIREKFPDCESCEVYDMCGSACIKSIEHYKECYFYKQIYTWFREFFKPYEKEFM